MSAAEVLELEIEDDSYSWIEEDHEGVTPWDIRNSVDAAEAMRRLAFYENEVSELRKVADSQRERIDRWEESEIQKFANNLNKYRMQLLAWFESEYERDPKRNKTLSYPAGKVTSSEVVEVSDKSALIAWAKDHAELTDVLIKTPDPKPEPAKAEIKKAVKSKAVGLNAEGELVDPLTGEVIPGAVLVRVASVKPGLENEQ